VLDLYETIEHWATWASGVTHDWETTTDPPWSGEEVFGPRDRSADA
jgi:hypothetical protein